MSASLSCPPHMRSEAQLNSSPRTTFEHTVCGNDKQNTDLRFFGTDILMLDRKRRLLCNKNSFYGIAPVRISIRS